MQKKAAASGRPKRGELARDQHEMIIVNPAEDIRALRFQDHLRKEPVDLLIGPPVVRAVEITARRQIVEQRPEDFIRKPVVIPQFLLRSQLHRVHRIA